MDPVLHHLRLRRAPLLCCHTHRHKKMRQEESHKSCNRQGEIWVKFKKSVWPGPSISSGSSPVICIFRNSLYYCLPDLITSYEHAIWYFILFRSESHLISKEKKYKHWKALLAMETLLTDWLKIWQIIWPRPRPTNIVFVLFSIYPSGMQDETNARNGAFFCRQKIKWKDLFYGIP